MGCNSNRSVVRHSSRRMHAGAAARFSPRILGAPAADHEPDRADWWALGLLVDCVARFWCHHLGLPVQLRYNMPIEVFYTIVPLILVLGFFSFTARDQQVLEQRYAASDIDVKIEVLAKQWAWDFNYVNENVYSPTVQASAAKDAPRGTLVESQLPTLYLPVGAKVEVQLESRDVIHSFWVVD